MTEISVVISTLGNYSGLERVLDHLDHQTVGPDRFDVVVVVDAADPDPAAAHAAIGERSYRVDRRTGDLPGLSANRNVGVAAATADLILFTDNDTPGDRRLLEEHLGWHALHPQEHIGVLGKVVWARELHVTAFMKWLDNGMQFDYPNIKGEEAGWGRFYGANVSVKRRLVDRVGRFDAERLPYLYDDLDFGYRASKVGFRLLYNRNAVVEHLRTMDLQFWKTKMSRLAVAERAFVRIHPEIEPYFHRAFSDAAGRPKARGRGRHLIRWIQPEFPVLGPRAWRSADLYFKQALAPDYLEAWRRDQGDPDSGPIAPYLLDNAVRG